jgi:hypothetical protein
VSVALWVFAPHMLRGQLAGVIWHAHEMLWGFIATIAVGFLLTASANWTGINPLKGKALGVLSVLWVTAQGEFSDVRTRPLGLRSGVGHLAARLGRGFVLPVAFEYTFWTERTPEALVRIGPAVDVAEAPGRGGREWTARIEQALTATLDGLSADAISRDPARFTPLLGGAVGVGGVYDGFRRVRAWLTGRRFRPAHADPGTGL